MKIIKINETSTMINAITEMLEYKEVCLYKSTNELKYTDQ